MLHGPAGAIMGQTRFSVGTVTPSAATEGFDLVGSDLFSLFQFLFSDFQEPVRRKKLNPAERN